jgi:hypothetical protein
MVTGLWSLIIVPLVSLFVGGMIASRTTGLAAPTRFEAVTHGLVVWAVAMLVGSWVMVSATDLVVVDASGLAVTLDSVAGFYWGLFALLLLGLLAAMGGAMLGVNEEQRRWMDVEATIASRTTAPEATPSLHH